jgi:EAL domain-containing protein (putative c-di-GMP-specific phosphodiesterase class I)
VGLVVPLFLYVSVTGFIVANAIAGALNISPTHTGAFSALIGATQYDTGIAGSDLVKRLPIDQLKIDKTFIKDLLFAPSAVAITKSIIALGSALNIEVIAEGVETFEVRYFLSTVGYTKYQGYAFGRPAPADQLQYSGRTACAFQTG